MHVFMLHAMLLWFPRPNAARTVGTCKGTVLHVIAFPRILEVAVGKKALMACPQCGAALLALPHASQLNARPGLNSNTRTVSRQWSWLHTHIQTCSDRVVKVSILVEQWQNQT